ncbi:MAG: hypothetical protein V8T87_11015 [Victivallales bacterium]
MRALVVNEARPREDRPRGERRGGFGGGPAVKDAAVSAEAPAVKDAAASAVPARRISKS